MNIYNPLYQMLSINGVLIRGFAKGDFLTITPKGADNQAKEGPDGSLSVAVLPNSLYDVKATLLHGTEAHKALMALRNSIRALPSPVMTFTYTDTLFRESWSGVCWFTTPAGAGKGDEGKDHEWSFEAQLNCTMV